MLYIGGVQKPEKAEIVEKAESENLGLVKIPPCGNMAVGRVRRVEISLFGGVRCS